MVESRPATSCPMGECKASSEYYRQFDYSSFIFLLEYLPYIHLLVAVATAISCRLT